MITVRPAIILAFHSRKADNILTVLGNPLIWSLIGFAAGIYLFFRGFALLRRKRFIANVPQSTIRGAAMGLVEVSGKVDGPYTIIAPLSAQDCFYYRVIAWTKKGDSWRKAAEESLSAPFFLDDGTGKLMLDARGADSELPSVFSEQYATTPPDFALRVLNRHGLSYSEGVKLEEYVIRAEETVFAMGTLRENSDDWPAVKLLSAEAAELQREQELGGVILATAAAIHRRPTTEPLQSYELPPKVVLGSTPQRRLFLSNLSQRELVQQLAWKSTLYIWGGPILTLACFWYLLSRFAE